jgi:selenocysteine lyase/cysteine desulfurase
MPENGTFRYEAGSQNISAIAGLHAALCWLQELGREVLNAQVDSLTQQLRDKLAGLAGVELFLPSDLTQHNGIISFCVEGLSPQSVETALGAQNIAVRAGLHCAPWAHKFMGTQNIGGTVRVSAGYYNTPKDLDLFITLVHDLVIH